MKTVGLDNKIDSLTRHQNKYPLKTDTKHITKLTLEREDVIALRGPKPPFSHKQN